MQADKKTLGWFGAMLRIGPAFVLAVIGTVMLLVNPAGELVENLKKEQRSLKAKYQSNAELLAHPAEYTAMLEKIRSSELPRVLPSDQYVDRKTHVNLSNSADHFKITLTRFNSLGQQARDFYRRHEYEVSVVGQFEDLVAFLHHLLTSRDQVIDLGALDIVGQGNGTVTMSASVFTYSYIEADTSS